MNKTYSSPIGMTQQFRFCPNPFRVDMYKGCDFGCKYCFANSNMSKGFDGFSEANFNEVRKLFQKAFASNKSSNDITIELLQHRVPLHCGGMSDPFQTREWSMGLTYKLIELSNEYNYPILFSTKTANLPEKYFDILNPDIHAFHSSIMGWSDDYIRKYETNTPTAEERLEFGKRLREKGFWWGIRIQPLVDISEAEQLVINAGSVPNYITVEHLKIPIDNVAIRDLFKSEYQNSKFKRQRYNLRNLETRTDVKINNVQRLQAIANKNGVLVGVGDNDLHHLSQSRCCCGVDVINDNFMNYLKYNMTYMSTGNGCTENFSDLWCPCSNCKGCFNSDTVKNKGKHVSFKEMVDDYINANDFCLPHKYRLNIQKQLFGVAQQKLF